MTQPPPLTPAERFACIVANLCNAVAARGAGRDPLHGPLVILIWSRLRRLAAQVAALAARIAAGQQRRYPARRPPSPRAAPRRHTPPSLPRGPAWLLPLVPGVSNFGSQLRHLLADPEMVALVDAAPQMRRLLRPLCRMLGVRPPPSLKPPSLKPPLAPARPPRPAASPCAAHPPDRPPPSPRLRPTVIRPGRSPPVAA